jgi:maleate isomerase
LQAIIDALGVFEIHRLVTVSPYPAEVDQLEQAFFEENGFNIVNARSLGLTSATDMARVSPDEIFRFCIESWNSRAQGLLIGCMNFNSLPIIERLEQTLMVPVISSNTATLWKLLRILGIKDNIPELI